MKEPGLCDHRDLIANSVYPLDSRIIGVPLNDEEKHSWLKFEETEKWRRECAEYEKDFIEVNHPFVPVVSGFAVAAFNELCRMYVKEDEEENVYVPQVTEVEFFPNSYGYVFYITLEALEENVAGVYEAAVFCHCDGGRRTLINFIRSTRVPVGTKVTWMATVISETLFYEAVKEEKKIIKGKLMKLRCNAKKGKKKSNVSARLKADYRAAKAVCTVSKRCARIVKPFVFKIKHSNPGDWCVPAKNTGLQPRSEHSCQGYDYHNPLTVFSECLEELLISHRRFERDRSQDWS